jgi:hypothetical protein
MDKENMLSEKITTRDQIVAFNDVVKTCSCWEMGDIGGKEIELGEAKSSVAASFFGVHGPAFCGESSAPTRQQ